MQSNQVPQVTKNQRKAIKKRSQLKTKYFKTNTAESLRSYENQENICSKLYEKKRKKYYNNLRLNKVKDSKAFWKNIKPFLSNKGTNI